MLSLLTQFSRKAGLSFASKWNHFHGRLFIGKFDELGPLHPDVIKTYYYSHLDRIPSVPRDVMKPQWREDCKLADIYRRNQRRYVALVSTLASGLVCFAILMLLSSAVLVGKGTSAVKRALSSDLEMENPCVDPESKACRQALKDAYGDRS
ncbi:hypothetical protein [Stenotrophomonas bentonitica]|uniref:hypothetical protein n=1 Tax=Stenotrophomonas bentonitica TaxID=1450134 RepID=UPI0031BA6456